MNRRTFIRDLVAAQPKPTASTDRSTTASISLEPWIPGVDNPWNAHAVNHLYGRLGFGATKQTIARALTMTPDEVINELFDDALVTTNLPKPPIGWQKWLRVTPYTGYDHDTAKEQDFDFYRAKADIRNHWTVLMTDQSLAAREKLTLFWHNHFVIDHEKTYYPQLIYRYLDTLRQNVWGDFRSFVRQMTINGAMLIYLDGARSDQWKINENFAREMLELFTMGRTGPDGSENYTSHDVRMVAAACSGWSIAFDAPGLDVLPSYFGWWRFDFNNKTTPFGMEPKTYGLKESGDDRIEADILDLIFEKRAVEISYFIAEKIYRNFVYMGDLTSEAYTVIAELAQLLRDNDWQLKPMLLRLFKSEHFFDLVHRGGAVKSPYDHMIGIMNKLDLPLTFDQSGSLSWYGKDSGMWLVAPPNVKGWRGYRSWLTTATLPKRINWIARDLMIGTGIAPQELNHRTDSPYPGIVYTDEQVTTWAKQFDTYFDDLESFAHELSTFFYAAPLEASVLEFVVAQSGIIHTYEWMTLSDAERIKPIRQMVCACMQLAEFQLT